MNNFNPYMLLLGDIPNALLIHIKLTMNNYDRLSMAFRGSLMTKWKFCIVDGPMKRPARALTEFDDWATMKAFIVS